MAMGKGRTGGVAAAARGPTGFAGAQGDMLNVGRCPALPHIMPLRLPPSGNELVLRAEDLRGIEQVVAS